MTPQLLTVQETAEKLRCGKKHVRDLIQRGALIGFRDSRRLLVDEASVLSYLKERRVSISHFNLQGQGRA